MSEGGLASTAAKVTDLCRGLSVVDAGCCSTTAERVPAKASLEEPLGEISEELGVGSRGTLKQLVCGGFAGDLGGKA